MRHGIPTTDTPDKPECLYVRILHHDFFFGPFANEEDLTEALIALDKADPCWDHDPFCVIYGANQLPEDRMFGFQLADFDIEKRAHNARQSAKINDTMKPEAETFTAYITKYALAKGVKEEQVTKSSIYPGSVHRSTGKLLSPKEWCDTKAEAVSRANEMRRKKIRFLKKQIAKLEKMKF